MSEEIDPYIRALFYLSESPVEVPAEHLRREEVRPLFLEKVSEVAHLHNISDLVDPLRVTDQILDELIKSGVIHVDVPRFAGEYLVYKNSRFQTHRSEFLQKDGIVITSVRIGPRFFPDVFDGYRTVHGMKFSGQDRPIPPSIIQQQNWTAVSARISSDTHSQIHQKVLELIEAIRQSDLEESLKKNALARAESVSKLLEAPNPPWEIVVDLLNNRYFTAFLNSMTIIQIIIGIAINA